MSEHGRRPEPNGHIAIYSIVGGPGVTVLNDRIRLFRSLVSGIDLRSFGDLHGIGIGFFIDGAIRSYGMEGVSGVRMEHKRGEINGKIGVPGQIVFGLNETEIANWLSLQIRELFKTFAIKINNSKRQVDTEALLAIIFDAVQLMRMLPPLPPQEGDIEVASRLRNFLANRRLAVTLGESVPDLGFKEGYRLELDDHSPTGFRVVSPFDEHKI